MDGCADYDRAVVRYLMDVVAGGLGLALCRCEMKWEIAAPCVTRTAMAMMMIATRMISTMQPVAKALRCCTRSSCLKIARIRPMGR